MENVKCKMRGNDGEWKISKCKMENGKWKIKGNSRTMELFYIFHCPFSIALVHVEDGQVDGQQDEDHQEGQDDGDTGV